MTTTTITKLSGPYRVVSNGRTIATFAGKVRADRKAATIVGAIVQGRQMPILVSEGRS